jgi:predicted dehydrogenase
MRRLGYVDVVAVCSKEPDVARSKAARFGIVNVYDNADQLISDAEIDVVDIVTPTYLHHPIALAALRHGKHVIVDKPLAVSAAQATELVSAARAAGCVNAVTFNYRYNPLVQQARVMIARGDIGEVSLVHGHYMQEWLLYETDFSWRLEPEKSGEAAMVADAGCHWFDLVEHVTGLRVRSVLAELQTTVPVRKRPVGGSREAFAEAGADQAEEYKVRVPDYGAVLLRFDNGARGSFFTSSLCAGHKNDLRFEINGRTASLKWIQEDPNTLWLGKRGEPDRVFTKDPPLLDPSIRHYAALPGGHNEAWPDAFRNVMSNIFEFIASGKDPRTADGVLFPTFEQGHRVAAIAEAIVESARRGGVWTGVTP